MGLVRLTAWPPALSVNESGRVGFFVGFPGGSWRFAFVRAWAFGFGFHLGVGRLLGQVVPHGVAWVEFRLGWHV